ncbi:hypothetical protein N0V90_012234 [Kalmusia sp. IMI 367209]|nr:hypothetical protein N0V90_012234 [Kalmusia sp. IMI 367209]
MPKVKGKQTVEQPVEMEVDDKENERPATARPSKFKEGTMNSTSAIVAPPDELWKGLDIEEMIERFNEEDSAPAGSATAATATATTTTVLRKRTAAVSRAASASHTPKVTPEPTSATVPATEGPLGRFSRAVASWFNGAGASFSALGKRKAGSETAEKHAVDKAAEERRKQVEEAYRQAKEQGLLPAPKVFVRPVSRARKTSASLTPSVPATPTPDGFAAPRTPALYKTPSKRDLHKQKKLSKRVSDLEFKLREARKELNLALGPHNPNTLPPLPVTDLPPTPKTDPSFSASETSPHDQTIPDPPATSSKVGKIIKKRKATGDSDGEFKPIPTDSDYSLDSGPENKKTKLTPPKKLTRKKSSRLTKKKSVTTKEEVVIVVPDGAGVPRVPDIPSGVPGKRVAVNDDGYGGFEHEMF